MTKAELFDGTVLEFPDDTAPEVVQQTAKRLTLERQPKAKAIAEPKPTFFEGLKQSAESGLQDLGRTLLSTYKSLDPDQAKSALEAGAAPLIAPLVASPPGAASIAVGEGARKGAELLGASPDVSAGIGTAANILTPGAIIPKLVRGTAAKAAKPVSELLQPKSAAKVAPESTITAPKVSEVQPVLEALPAPKVERAAALADDIPDFPVPQQKGPRGVTDILKSQEGSIRIGPLRMREGKPVEAPTLDEAKKAVEDLTVSKSRIAVGRFIEESSKTLQKTAGEEGGELVRLVRAARNDAERETGKAAQPLKQRIATLKTEAQRSNFVDVLDGKAQPMDDTVRQAALFARSELETVGNRAMAAGLEIKNPITGVKVPFQKRENFFPHIFEGELGQMVRDPKYRAQLKQQIKGQMEQGGKVVEDKQVEQALQAMVKASKSRYGHLEMARVVDLGSYVRKPEVLVKYLNDAYRRVNLAEKLGPNYERAEELLSSIGLKHGDDIENFGRTYYQRFAGTEPVGDPGMKAAITTATNFQAASKLGQAVISNLSQPAYTAVVAGAKNAAKGYASVATKEGRAFAEKAGVVLDSTIREFLNESLETSGQGIAGKGAEAVLKYTGFTSVEKMNRMVAANAGKFFAQETFEKLAKNPGNKRLRETLTKMNVNVEDALSRGELSEDDLLKAAQNIVNRTQFKVDVTELPLDWSSDYGRLITQFKKFSFKAGQMIKEEILKEMGKGNVKPFLRAAAIFPVVGAGVVKAKDTIRFGEQKEYERNVADYLAAIGTFGLFTDFFANSGRASVSGLNYIAGPTLGMVGDAWTAARDTRNRVVGNDDKNPINPIGKFFSRHLAPVVGPSVRQLFSDAKEKQGRTSTRRTERKGRASAR